MARAARAGSVKITVQGLDELRRDLKAAGDEGKTLGRELKRRLKKVADTVAADARGRVPYGPDRGGHARDTIKGGSTATSAYVQGGKAENPYYGWLDFGRRTPNGGAFSAGRSGRAAQIRANSGIRVGPWANSGTGPRGGRFIYPAIEDNSKKLIQEVGAALDATLKKENL